MATVRLATLIIDVWKRTVSTEEVLFLRFPGISKMCEIFCCYISIGTPYTNCMEFELVELVSAYISFFLTDVISGWLTHLVPSQHITMRNTPPCMATGLIGVTGTSTADSTWPCSVSKDIFFFTQHCGIFKMSRYNWARQLSVCVECVSL